MFKKGNETWKKGLPITKARRKKMSESATTRWAKARAVKARVGDDKD